MTWYPRHAGEIVDGLTAWTAPNGSQNPVTVRLNATGRRQKQRYRCAAVALLGQVRLIRKSILGQFAGCHNQDHRKADVVASGGARVPIAVIGFELRGVFAGLLRAAVELQKEAKPRHVPSITPVAVRPENVHARTQLHRAIPQVHRRSRVHAYAAPRPPTTQTPRLRPTYAQGAGCTSCRKSSPAHRDVDQRHWRAAADGAPLRVVRPV